MTNKTIAFIGTGNMSFAIIAGLVKNGYDQNHIIATNRNLEKLNKVSSELGVKTTSDNIEAVQNADVVVLSVKPQMRAALCQTFSEQGLDLSNKLIISVAAGITVKRLSEMLAQPSRIIRCMPNTPSLLGLGVSGLFSANATDADKQICEHIFASVGIVTWLNKESQINDIIAVTGSSPAYFFLFMEAIEEKARALGFSQEQARQLVQQTALGAANMVASQQVPISELRANVTSKGGTTAAAIAHFESNHLKPLVSNAMDACIARAEQMEKEL
jgi:pyrroline-5-carboxylate reductase